MKTIIFALLLPFLLTAATPETPLNPDPAPSGTSIYYLSSNGQTDSLVRALLPNIITINYDIPLIQEIDLRSIVAAQIIEAFQYRKEGVFIAEQSGLSLKALNGLPGPLYPWFQMQLGNIGIVNLVRALGNESAEIKTVVGYAKDKDNIQFFEGSLQGKVVPPRGIQRTNWDTIFMPEGQVKTLAEMDPLLKNSLSSRRFAFDHLKAYLNLPEKGQNP
jgi:non-canonical purine NTP pyrophosphatase (RdgB/HAM1 family)